MTVTVRPARSGDGAGISRAWLSAAAYYTDLDPEHFQVPGAEGLAEGWDSQFDQPGDDSLNLVAEVRGQVVGWLWARIEPRGNASAALVREHGWTRLVVDSLIVDRDHWRGGAGNGAPGGGRGVGTRPGCTPGHYAYSPVSVPFYEDHMGYGRRSIVFQKRLCLSDPGVDRTAVGGRVTMSVEDQKIRHSIAAVRPCMRRQHAP